MKKIGVIGLGIMGKGIANNFLKKGYTMFVWNRTKNVLNEFVENGVVVCDSPAEVANSADIVFEVTSNDSSSRQVWIGKNGILSSLRKDNILVTCATLSIGWVDKLAALCEDNGISFADMALTGGRIGAETGNLILLCGGKQSTIDELSLYLPAISKKVYHFGPVGHGMRYKLILNFLQSVHLVGFGQAMKIAKSYNMNLEKVSEALTERPGGLITEIAKNAYFADPVPLTFSIENITKDLTYAKKFAKGLDISLLDRVLSLYKKGVKNNLSQEDWAAINKII